MKVEGWKIMSCKMKFLKDLVVTRRELQDWSNSIVWDQNGSIFIMTLPELTICEAVYKEEINRHSKQLFHIKDYPLPLVNKFEYDISEYNPLLNSQPESFVKMCVPSIVDNSIAVLTNNYNVIIFQNQKLIVNLDEPFKNVKQRSYHSVSWNADGTALVVGNEASQIIMFTSRLINEDKQFKYSKTISLNKFENDWIVGIRWVGQYIICYTSVNSIYMIEPENEIVKLMKPPSKFLITDINIIGNNILTAETGNISKIDISSNQISCLKMETCEPFLIVPLNRDNSAIIISNKTSFKVNLTDGLTLFPDDIISHHIETRFNKWNTIFNEFQNYHTSVSLYGLTVSPDGYSLALLYDISRTSLKYTITSEMQYKICFIPLYTNWKITSLFKGLGWYQNYHIYNLTLPEIVQDSERPVNTDIDFKIYLRNFINETRMNNLKFSALINRCTSNDIYNEMLFSYAMSKKNKITNPLDIACIISLANILKKESSLEQLIIPFHSDFITENFDFYKNKDINTIKSEEGHIWTRCSTTYLPLLTTSVKICPVTNSRIIDIQRDKLNEYGWFTRTILEELSDESVFSGAQLISSP